MLLATILFAAALPSNVHLQIQPDEARAVLAILDRRAGHKAIGDAEWQTLFSSDGYVRLKKREASIKAPFDDDDFRKFVMSDELLARRAELHRVLDDWMTADLAAAASRALEYLPRDATIRATIYPAIKPQHNSFVFEGDAIFISIDDQPRERFEAIVTHEIHHIGYESACPPPAVRKTIDDLPANLEMLANWIGAFGEGYATLAAGGDRDPERMMQPNVHTAFEDGLRDFDKNFRDVQGFFTDLLDEKLRGEAARDRGFEFFGLVGPWYTVGWKMCVVIEKTLGRDALIAAFCDPRTLLATYNRAATLWEKDHSEHLPRWDPRLVAAFTKPSS